MLWISQAWIAAPFGQRFSVSALFGVRHAGTEHGLLPVMLQLSRLRLYKVIALPTHSEPVFG